MLPRPKSEPALNNLDLKSPSSSTAPSRSPSPTSDCSHESISRQMLRYNGLFSPSFDFMARLGQAYEQCKKNPCPPSNITLKPQN